MGVTPDVSVRIDALVLHGFPPGAHRGMAEALQAELARLLAADPPGALPSALPADPPGALRPAAAAPPAVHVPSVTLAPDTGPAAAGRAVARALHRSLATPEGRR